MAPSARSGSPRASSAASSRRRLGSEQPRVFTPPLRRLTPKTSLGFAAVEFAEQVCGIELYPWQRWLLIHALELLPDGSFRFRNVVVLVARQNGKSTLSQVLALFFMYVLGADLVLGTAQDLDTAEEVWDGALEIIEETPELAELADKPVRVNGKKTIRLMSGERYKVKAANRRAGRGMSGDLILLDELREHQSWDAWGAITKTTMARPDAQVWALSNAGDAASIVLRYLRKMAHKSLGDPDGINTQDDPAALLPDDDDAADEYGVDADTTLGIFEWSAPPGCEIRDRDGWAQANPSLGHGQTTERAIASACATDPEWVFRTEVLCQWSDGTLEGPFPPGSWDKCLDNASSVADGGSIRACVDVSWDRSTAHVAVAGWREDGLPHVEVVATRAGVEWVLPWLTDASAPHRAKWPVVVQTNGAPASALIPDMKAAGLAVVEWVGGDLGQACGMFYDRVRAAIGEGSEGRPLRHLAQPVLDVAAATAVTRPMGDAWLWDRKRSPHDTAPLVAATGALWALLTGKAEPHVSAYESTDLMVV